MVSERLRDSRQGFCGVYMTRAEWIKGNANTIRLANR